MAVMITPPMMSPTGIDRTSAPAVIAARPMICSAVAILFPLRKELGDYFVHSTHGGAVHGYHHGHGPINFPG